MSEGKRPALRPKLAGTLILTRNAKRGREILMGRRSTNHVFMPETYVFPGGRAERADSYAPLAGDINAGDLAIMERNIPAKRARAASAAAIREMAEEAGYLVGRPSPCPSRHKSWKPFRQKGVTPDASNLTLIARAITPPGRVRRFDAWFFHADADTAIAGRLGSGDQELEDLRWVTKEEAEGLRLPHVTRFVLQELERKLANPNEPPRHFRELARQYRVDPL